MRVPHSFPPSARPSLSSFLLPFASTSSCFPSVRLLPSWSSSTHHGTVCLNFGYMMHIFHVSLSVVFRVVCSSRCDVEASCSFHVVDQWQYNLWVGEHVHQLWSASLRVSRKCLALVRVLGAAQYEVFRNSLSVPQAGQRGLSTFMNRWR